MKLKFTVLIFIVLLFLSGCHGLFGADVFPEIICQNAFENDEYLIIDVWMINKKTGKVNYLNSDMNAKIPEIDNLYRPGEYTFKYSFNEDSIECHTFIESYDHDPVSLQRIERLHPCIVSYDYSGNEISRIYTDEPILKEQYSGPFNEAFSIGNDYSKFYDIKYHSTEQEAIMTHLEKYSDQSTTGIAKPVGEEYWFSLTVSDEQHYNSGFGLICGIETSQIFKYDSLNNQFICLYENKKKNELIIDFDEHGFYTLDSKRRLMHYDFNTEKSELIHTFSAAVSNIDITDQYIAVAYGKNANECIHFIYDKSGKIICDTICS